LQHYLDQYGFTYNHRDDFNPMYHAVTDRVSKVRYGRYGTYAPIGEDDGQATG